MGTSALICLSHDELCFISHCLTHWGRDQIDAISQTTYSNTFSRMKMNEFHIGFPWSLFLRFELTIFQHWFRYWLGADLATSHYLNQWWLVYWRIYASLGLNELRLGNKTVVCAICCIIFYARKRKLLWECYGMEAQSDSLWVTILFFDMYRALIYIDSLFFICFKIMSQIVYPCTPSFHRRCLDPFYDMI